MMNDYMWKVVEVSPNAEVLIDRTLTRTVATTDPRTLCIYLSNELSGDFKKRVIAHEMGHACCFSYGLLNEIWECCYPDKRIQMEEFICNYVSLYGELIYSITYNIIGDDALYQLPYYLEQLVS